MQNDATFRPMRRFKQQLTAQECETILKDAYRGFLSVHGENGLKMNAHRAAVLCFALEHMTGKRVKEN